MNGRPLVLITACANAVVESKSFFLILAPQDGKVLTKYFLKLEMLQLYYGSSRVRCFLLFQARMTL